MTKQNLSHYQSLLEDLLAQLGSVAQSKEEIEAERSGDEIDDLQRREAIALAAHSLDSRWERKAAVRRALARIEDGDFGHCQECGDEINARRLEALPWADHCVRCQEQLEEQGIGMAA